MFVSFVLYIASFFSYVVICVVYSLYVCKPHTHNDISDTKNDTKRYTYIERHRTTHETTTYKEPLNSFYVINKKFWGLGVCFDVSLFVLFEVLFLNGGFVSCFVCFVIIYVVISFFQ